MDRRSKRQWNHYSGEIKRGEKVIADRRVHWRNRPYMKLKQCSSSRCSSTRHHSVDVTSACDYSGITNTTNCWRLCRSRGLELPRRSVQTQCSHSVRRPRRSWWPRGTQVSKSSSWEQLRTANSQLCNKWSLVETISQIRLRSGGECLSLRHSLSLLSTAAAAAAAADLRRHCQTCGLQPITGEWGTQKEAKEEEEKKKTRGL